MPLHIAVACKSVSALKALLEAKMDPNVEDDMKETPRHQTKRGPHADRTLAGSPGVTWTVWTSLQKRL